MIPANAVVRTFLILLAVLYCSVQQAHSATDRYDLVYTWNSNLESVLDYKQELEALFDNGAAKHLKVVGRGKEFGVIYDTNGSAKDVIVEIARQGQILRQAGLEEAWAVEDKGYHELYNVSYGLGPNLDALKKTYKKIYTYLGKDVGKDLFIEKTSAENYTLIYRRRGDQRSTVAVAKRHGKTLRKKGIRTSITPENNNEVVYGESSLLNDSGEVTTALAKTTRPKKAEEAKTPSTKSLPKLTRKADKSVKNVSRKPSQAKPVRLATDSSVEENVENLIKRMRRKGKIRRDEKTSWMVYDLEKDRSLVDINANQLFQAASMIKPFVGLAFFHQVKQGKLIYGPKSRRMMEAMIQRSSNSATNWIMRQVGGPASCQKILRNRYGHIFKNTVIKEYIPAGGRTYKNSALPSDYIRFLRSLWNKELPYGKELRRVMALPGRDRLYHGTPIPQGTLVYNKTGSTAHLIGDMGILAPKTVQGKRYPYAIVGIIERSSRPSNYGSWMLARSNVIREVSTLIYKEMKRQHRLM